MTCKTCGADITVNFRAQRKVCSGCDRNPNFCTCSPVAFVPAWLRNLTARDETGRVAA